MLTGMVPITTVKDAAPESLLHIVSCKCVTGCTTGGCSCKKAGLRCSVICKNCAGNGCVNSPDPNLNEEDTVNEEYDDLNNTPPAEEAPDEAI